MICNDEKIEGQNERKLIEELMKGGYIDSIIGSKFHVIKGSI